MRRQTAVAAASLIASLAIAACGGSDTAPAGMGTLVVQLTDAPFPTDSVKSVDIFVVRVEGRAADVDEAAADQHVATQSESEGDGWKTLATPNASINLLALQNGVVSTVGEAQIV